MVNLEKGSQRPGNDNGDRYGDDAGNTKHRQGAVDGFIQVFGVILGGEASNIAGDGRAHTQIEQAVIANEGAHQHPHAIAALSQVPDDERGEKKTDGDLDHQ